MPALLTRPGDLDPRPLIRYLVAVLRGASTVPGRSPAALEELCWAVLPEHARASRTLGPNCPSGSPEPEVLLTAPSPLCRQFGASLRPLLKNSAVSPQLQEFLQGDAGKGKKSVFFCGMCLAPRCKGAPKACGPAGPHPRSAWWGGRVWVLGRCGALWLGSPWEPKLSWGSLGEVCGFSLPNALRSEQVEVKLHLEFM